MGVWETTTRDCACAQAEGAKVIMSRAGEPQGTSSGQQNATDAEFRAAFSLLPQINNILTSVGQSDRSAVEKAVGI